MSEWNQNATVWLENLEKEEIDFIKNFVLMSGSLKELGKIYDVSYPTVRLRLDRVIQKIKLNDHEENEPYINYIKTLAIDDKIDFDVAKALIEKYKSVLKGEKNG
ncbi:DUF2089 family protein [Peptoniphilaceae bacterium SGI.097]